MVTLPSCHVGGKPGRVETARTVLPSPPVWLRGRPNPGDVELVDELIEARATLAVIKVFRFLARTCIRYFQAGTWVFQTTIAKATGLGDSTVRVALDWLEERGWIVRTEESISGEDRAMIWCLWLLPSGSVEGERFDFGQGFSRRSGRPPGAFFGAPGAESCAQKTAPNDSKWIRTKKSTTTDAVVVVVDGSREEKTEEKTVETPPAPPPDPRLAELLDRLLADAPAERAELDLRLPAIAAGFEFDWVLKALVVTIAQWRKGKVKTTLADYAPGVLANFQREGGPPASIKIPASAPPKRSMEEVLAEQRDKAKAKADAERRAKEEQLAKEAPLQARWDALPEADREQIRGRVRAEQPWLNQRLKSFFHAACLGVLETIPSA